MLSGHLKFYSGYCANKKFYTINGVPAKEATHWMLPTKPSAAGSQVNKALEYYEKQCKEWGLESSNEVSAKEKEENVEKSFPEYCTKPNCPCYDEAVKKNGGEPIKYGYQCLGSQKAIREMLLFY